MIDRFLYTAIETGIAAIQADPTRIDDIFRQFVLGTAEVDGIKEYFAREGVRLVHNYPRRNLKPPIYSIVLESEQEVANRGTFIGDDLPDVLDVPDLSGVDIKGSIYQARYGIHVVCEQPDLTRYYYEILKSIIVGQKAYFDECGVFAIGLGGADLALDPRWSPENYFVRKLMFDAQYVFKRLDRGALNGKFTSIDGAFVDNGERPGNIGDVQTNITTFVLGDE